jgi:hypothetical protein
MTGVDSDLESGAVHGTVIPHTILPVGLQVYDPYCSVCSQEQDSAHNLLEAWFKSTLPDERI